MYDYLIVGAGIFGAVFAREMTDKGKRCLVIDKSSHIAGHIYTNEIEGIQVHQYGAHIFHTSDEEVWNYVNQFTRFNHFINAPLASYKDELFNLPFNMNTFYKMWGSRTPEEAKQMIQEQTKALQGLEPANLEEQAIKLVGQDIYEKLIKGYTEKQWGRDCKDLPAFIIKRLPVRFIYDNNYFNDRYQGIPTEGYTAMVENMLKGIEVRLDTDYYAVRGQEDYRAKKTLFTGMIDEYFNYCFGELEYRSLRFDTQILDVENFQGNAVVNYTEREIPYTRIIEHKHFAFGQQPKTVVTYEYPATWKTGDEPYYPVNNEVNDALYEKYKEKAESEEDVIFGGRLGQYKYYDMDKVVRAALHLVKEVS